jgi:glycosyltransferase involved in cell wall biosynthesis
MKLVVFAQTPPPLHGQSYMTELLLNGLAANDYGIQVFHVNAQFAESSKDIGRFRLGKVLRLVGYCVKALWFRVRHSASNLYYIPAPPVRTPLYRDWIILLLLRPFFARTIFHWHAAGLGEWIEKQPKLTQRISHLALDRAHLSISLGRFNETDAAVFKPRRAVIVPNGIPDPCPNFSEIQTLRRERLRARVTAWETPGAIEKHGRIQTNVLYLSLCSREKGVFDAIEGVCQANRLCRSNHLPFEFTLTIAGPFPDAETDHFFNQTLERLGNPPTIRHIGFADAETKRQLLREADIFCFPTFYYGESFGLVIVEAMSYGIPVVSTRWRSVPDLFPANYPGLVDIQSPDQIASALLDLATTDDTDQFRNRFLNNYTLEKFLQNITTALKPEKVQKVGPAVPSGPRADENHSPTQNA